MAWTLLVLAGLLEIGWAVGLKLSAGFTRPGWTVLTAVSFLLSFVLLARALRTIPLGTGYAVWTGIGAAGTAVVGMVWLGESREAMRLVSLGLVVAGILGLKLAAP